MLFGLRIIVVAVTLLASTALLPAIRSALNGVKYALGMSADPGNLVDQDISRRDLVSKFLTLGPAVISIISNSDSQPAIAKSIEKPNVQGLPSSGFFLQHAVLKVNDMEANIKFWCDALGMHIVRERTVNGVRTVFVAYGNETLSTGTGGYFALELQTAEKASYGIGTSFKYIGITLPEKPIPIGMRATEAGGQVVPHWFLERDYIEITSPDGVPVHVKQGNKYDPVSVIAFGTHNIEKSKNYFKKTLQMTDQSQLQKLLGPLAGNNVILGYKGSSVNVALVEESSPVKNGAIFDKIAVLTRNTTGMAELVADSDFGRVLFVGEVPGIGTKVANTIDKEYHDVVFVDYDDFEKEL